MPRGDRTGLMGMGPMTGRSAGFCADYNTPGFANPVSRRGLCGFGIGRGRGRGIKWRHWFYAAGQPFRSWVNPRAWGAERGSAPAYTQSMRKEAEIDMLKREAADLENGLQAIRDRLAKISEER
jgi:hypothetical protein